MTIPTLYHCRDARSFRVLWMLEELGADYRLELLPFPPRDRAPGYLDLNPLGTIPLFLEGEARMTESAAICHYLATTRGDGSLAIAPGEPGYAAYLDALSFGEATLTFPQTLVLRYAMFEPEARRVPQVAEDYRQWYLARLRGLEAMLSDAEYVTGDRFTAADISVGYALMLAEFVRIGDGGLPRVAAYWERLRSRPAFARAKAAQIREQAA
jgi:glutathione S-transferase